MPNEPSATTSGWSGDVHVKHLGWDFHSRRVDRCWRDFDPLIRAAIGYGTADVKFLAVNFGPAAIGGTDTFP